MTNSKDKIKIGDLVEWKACCTIKSKVEEIKPSHWNEDVMIYELENGCGFQRNEIRKVK